MHRKRECAVLLLVLQVARHRNALQSFRRAACCYSYSCISMTREGDTRSIVSPGKATARMGAAAAALCLPGRAASCLIERQIVGISPCYVKCEVLRFLNGMSRSGAEQG